MSDIMQELLDYSEGNLRLNYEQVSVEAFAESLQKDFEPHFENSNIRFALSCRSTGTMVVDKARLRRVLSNIITNSQDAIQERGIISVLIEEKNGDIRFAVEDNGKGIPEDLELESVESLGLQLVSTLVEQLDGELELKREQGTEFRINIKVAECGCS